ncbi:MAG TPA: TSUP family transporter [Acetobacteraceae bacterium]|nr:TSUP family transporter [Acetobacteraceae bacterium]
MTSETYDGKVIHLGPDDSLIRKTELIISGVLRGGVLLSVAVILGGIAWFYALRFAGALPHPTFPDTLPAVWQGLKMANPLAIVVLGLLILLATPVLRVAVSIVAFALEEDRTYVIITALVLAILLFSIFGVGDWLGRPEPALVQDDTLVFFFLVLFSSAFAGFIGALVGLGGGVFIVPILTLGFHVQFNAAIGASIVSVIATSSGAAAAYVRDRMTNLRVGMFLEVATTLGAICGALLSTFLNATVLFIVFGVVLLISALPLVMRLGEELPANVINHKWAERLHLPGSYPDRRTHETVSYQVAHIRWGFSMMYVAGLVSGLLGIGSGTFKVLAMDTAMRLPMKVSTTTSNFMIGVTAAASAGIFFQRGYIDPAIAAPVALGVLLGATVGARTLTRMSNVWLKRVFVPIIVLVALNMLARGMGWL